MAGLYWFGKPFVAPVGGAPRLPLAALPRPELVPASASVTAFSAAGRPLTESLQSGALTDAMNPASRCTNGSSWKSQTLARVVRALIAGKFAGLRWVSTPANGDR